MCLVNHSVKSKRVLLSGMLLLALAAVWRMVIRLTHVSEDVGDFGLGLFYGMAITCMILSIWMANRGGRARHDDGHNA